MALQLNSLQDNSVDVALEDASFTISDAAQRVLDVAERLFMERGYAAVTLRDIAQALNMKQASLYYHFPEGKEQLFVHVVQRTLKRYQAGIDQAINDNALTLRHQLVAVVIWFAQQPPMNLLALIHVDIPALSQASQDELSASVYQAIFNPIRRIFLQAYTQGVIRKVQPEMITGAFLAIMNAISYRQSHADNRVEPEIMATEIVSVLLDGLHER